MKNNNEIIEIIKAFNEGAFIQRKLTSDCNQKSENLSFQKQSTPSYFIPLNDEEDNYYNSEDLECEKELATRRGEDWTEIDTKEWIDWHKKSLEELYEENGLEYKQHIANDNLPVNNWEDCEISSTESYPWDWSKYDYRIKKTRPMTFEEIVEYWKEHKTEIFNIKDGKFKGQINLVDCVEKQIHIANTWYSVEEFFNSVNKENGLKFVTEDND